MAKKSPTQRIARLEDIVGGAGFLLMKLQSKYGGDFGEGMRAQVRDCLKDCQQVAAARAQREEAAAKATGAAS
jgi:hypothetical protein